MPLPGKVREAEAKVRFERGVLTVSLPRDTAEAAKKIPIESCPPQGATGPSRCDGPAPFPQAPMPPRPALPGGAAGFREAVIISGMLREKCDPEQFSG